MDTSIVSQRTCARSTPRAVGERELIDHCLSGDGLAWTELHDRYARIASRFLRALGVGSWDIEDARQEVFLQLYRSLASFRGEAALTSWLYRLCLTQAGRVRRRKRVARRVLELSAEARLPGDELTSLSPSDAWAKRRVSAALARLSRREREFLLLHTLEDRPGKEIAALTGASLASVWRVLCYARQKFRAALRADISFAARSEGSALARL